MSWGADNSRNGIIVTLREQESGDLYSVHVPGKRRDALKYVAQLIDASGLDWRLLCYSTPHTIIGDLRSQDDRRRQLGAIEGHALRGIGRLDLLDPELAP